MLASCVLASLLIIHVAVIGFVREDGRCGMNFDDAMCDASSLAPCCSAQGFCGGSVIHCQCASCVDFRKGENPFFDVRESLPSPPPFRADLRCGAEASGAPCNPTSSAPCCSLYGWCGMGEEYCSCPACVDYRLTVAGVGNLYP